MFAPLSNVTAPVNAVAPFTVAEPVPLYVNVDEIVETFADDDPKVRAPPLLENALKLLPLSIVVVPLPVISRSL